MKLFLYELKKIFSPKILIVLAAVLMLQFWLCYIPSGQEHEYSIDVYKQYLEQYGGEFTEEKYQSLLARSAEIGNIIAVHDDMVDAYQKEKISFDEFEEYNFQYHKASSEESTVKYLVKKSEYFKEIGGCVYFYDTDWEDFLGGAGFNFFAAFAVIFLVIPVFCNEHQSNARSMLVTSARGQLDLCISKLCAAFTAAFLTAAAVYAVKYAAFCTIQGNYGEYAVHNLLGHYGYGDISLVRYYFTDLLIKSAAWAVGAVFICAVSNLTKNMIFTAFLSFVPIVFSALIGDFSAGIYRYLLLGGVLAENYAADFNMTAFTFALAIKTVIYSAICCVLWRKRE